MIPTRISKLISVPQSSIYSWISWIENDEDILEHIKPKRADVIIPPSTKKKVKHKIHEQPVKTSTCKLGAQTGIRKKFISNILKEGGGYK
jgi:hypothetical protein